MGSAASVTEAIGALPGSAALLDALALLERQHAEHQRQAAAIRAELGLG